MQLNPAGMTRVGFVDLGGPPESRLTQLAAKGEDRLAVTQKPPLGRVDRSQVKHVHQHELDTANRLADLGEVVTFIASGRRPRPDAQLSDGRNYEFKVADR